MNTNEREERLKQVRENRRIWYNNQGQVTKDIDFLLSLLDSQAADGDLHHCALCEDPNFIYRDCALAAATQMRNQCVAKVREMRRSVVGVTDPKLQDAILRRNTILNEVIIEIESLTLDVEQKEAK